LYGGFIAASALAGCNAILGLNELSLATGKPDSGLPDSMTPIVDATPDNFVGECTTNAECTERATAAAVEKDAGLPDVNVGGMRVVPAICLKPEQRCVELLSEDCTEITGDFRDDDAIVLGTLFSTVGAQGAMNLQRQRGATLAADQINNVGGIPSATTPDSTGRKRPLVMVSCNEATPAGGGPMVLPRAGAHLITNLRVPAIVGPNTSQDTIELSNTLSVAHGTVLLTPTAVAQQIADLADNDLTWLMVPSDQQRGRLMKDQINLIESEVRQTRNKTVVKLGIVYRKDAVGEGTYRSLNDLQFNGAPLNAPINTGTTTGNVQIDGYEFTAANQDPIVNKYANDFKPDIMVLAGLAESITTILNPIEQRWAEAGADRPYYVLTDQVKGPDLIASCTNNPGLRPRVRGTGITPGAKSVAVQTAFELDYRAKYGSTPTASGAGPSFDATFAIAYALAATRDLPVTGPNIAKGLGKLAGGTEINVGSSSILNAFMRLGAGENISAIGTFVPFEWDERGAVVNGTIEIWCVGNVNGTPAYQSAKLTHDIKTDTIEGMYTPCP
jgi:branched-chain amino acid transport system substrate-binding protein